MSSRTIIQFNQETDVMPTVEAWAKANGYKKVASDSPGQRYKKGSGLMVAPTIFEASQDQGQVTFTAWVSANLLARSGALFMIPAEMKIESGGFAMNLPRKTARKAVNKLLSELGQPALE